MIRRSLLVLFALSVVCRPQTPEAPDPNRPRLMRTEFRQGSISEITFRKDNRNLVTDDGENLLMWDVESGLLVQSITGGTGSKVTPNGTFVWDELHKGEKVASG
ncbi:MAG: hypothetical protein LAQ69_41555 [Acidobacteriia bacterium]|nr:hypothetical protein [Terriglobia bacterium]